MQNLRDLVPHETSTDKKGSVRKKNVGLFFEKVMKVIIHQLITKLEKEIYIIRYADLTVCAVKDSLNNLFCPRTNLRKKIGVHIEKMDGKTRTTVPGYDSYDDEQRHISFL